MESLVLATLWVYFWTQLGGVRLLDATHGYSHLLSATHEPSLPLGLIVAERIRLCYYMFKAGAVSQVFVERLERYKMALAAAAKRHHSLLLIVQHIAQSHCSKGL